MYFYEKQFIHQLTDAGSLNVFDKNKNDDDDNDEPEKKLCHRTSNE